MSKNIARGCVVFSSNICIVFSLWDLLLYRSELAVCFFGVAEPTPLRPGSEAVEAEFCVALPTLLPAIPAGSVTDNLTTVRTSPEFVHLNLGGYLNNDHRRVLQLTQFLLVSAVFITTRLNPRILAPLLQTVPAEVVRTLQAFGAHLAHHPWVVLIHPATIALAPCTHLDFVIAEAEVLAQSFLQLSPFLLCYSAIFLDDLHTPLICAEKTQDFGLVSVELAPTVIHQSPWRDGVATGHGEDHCAIVIVAFFGYHAVLVATREGWVYDWIAFVSLWEGHVGIVANVRASALRL